MIPMIYCAHYLDLLKQKKHSRKSRKCLNLLVRPAGFEPAAYGFEVRRSIQLSYGRMFVSDDRGQRTLLRPRGFGGQADDPSSPDGYDATRNLTDLYFFQETNSGSF